MRYRKRPARPAEAKDPAAESDRTTRLTGPIIAGCALGGALGAALLAGMHRVLHYEYLRTGYIFVAAMIIPLIPMAVVLTYVAHRRPRAVFTTQVEIPGTNAVRFVMFFMACAYYTIAAGTMVYGFITRYPVHAFLWATGPATVGYVCTQQRPVSLHTLLMPKQSFTLSPHAPAGRGPNPLDRQRPRRNNGPDRHRHTPRPFNPQTDLHHQVRLPRHLPHPTRRPPRPLQHPPR